MDNEQRAMYFAMAALNWHSMTPTEQLANLAKLVARAAAFERILQ